MVPDIPKNALTRGVRIATLPASYAGRTAWGFGKKVAASQRTPSPRRFSNAPPSRFSRSWVNSRAGR